MTWPKIGSYFPQFSMGCRINRGAEFLERNTVIDLFFFFTHIPHLLYLLGKLSCRSQDERLTTLLGHIQLLEDGHGKCSCLSSTRLSLSNHITTWGGGGERERERERERWPSMSKLVWHGQIGKLNNIEKPQQVSEIETIPTVTFTSTTHQPTNKHHSDW